jgi:hypothetical protein
MLNGRSDNPSHIFFSVPYRTRNGSSKSSGVETTQETPRGHEEQRPTRHVFILGAERTFRAFGPALLLLGWSEDNLAMKTSPGLGLG